MECPECKSDMTQSCKAYYVGAGSGKTSRITEYECDYCGAHHIKDKTITIPEVMHDAALARFITFGQLQ